MRINSGKLEKPEELADFLQKRIGENVKVDGSLIELGEKNNLKARQVKTYIKRFLHNRGLRERFRVLVNKDEITLQMIETEEEEINATP